MERVTWKLTLPYVKQTTNGDLLYDSGNSNPDPNKLEVWDGEGSERKAQEAGDMCIPMADLHGCLVETNTILQSNYPSIKK